jgi:hypothetical protein
MPAARHGLHHYHFRLLALSVDHPFPSAADRPVVRSNAGHAAIPLPKWPLWEFISDDGSAVLHARVYEAT